MEYYRLCEDEGSPSKLIFEDGSPRPRTVDSDASPPPDNKYLGPASDSEWRFKACYESIVCPVCGRYDEDEVYNVGFEDPVDIRIRGDFGEVQDITLISDKFLSVLRREKVRGFETKQVGSTIWHALRVTERVDCDERVMDEKPPRCPACDRLKRTLGCFRSVSELTPPKRPMTLFTTKTGWARLYGQRTVFMTGDVALALRAGRVLGGYCNRMMSGEEAAIAAKKGPNWLPSGSTVFLNGTEG